MIDRRSFLKAAAGAFSAAVCSAQAPPPNIVFIYADDLGYGDLGCYGSKIPTPNIDRLASEGVRFTQFYSASAVSSPSRAALLTGRYPTRVGVSRVLYPSDKTGLSEDETTIAQILKPGYKTMCIGKWHLGTEPQYLPTTRGFDEYYGLPYSNDLDPLPLLHNRDVVEITADQKRLTQHYTEQAANFIARSKGSPFFLYMPHTAPHIPLACSERFRGKSGLGAYGDSVMELDWSVGEVMRTISENGLDDNTLVMFSSDNGPWFQGSAGRLRGRKGMTYEGGMREPFLARFPGRIPAGLVCNSVASTMDILPTLARLGRAGLPGKPLDGIDIWPLLSGETESLDREVLLYFDGNMVQCARRGRWKLHVARQNSPAFSPEPFGGRKALPLSTPELYDLQSDPEEAYDVAGEHPEIVADIRARIESSIVTFPNDVRYTWASTMATKVEGMPAGAWPVATAEPKP